MSTLKKLSKPKKTLMRL